MLRRFFSGSLRFHLRLPLQTPASHLLPPAYPDSLSSFNRASDLHFLILRLFSTSGRDGSNGNGGIWNNSDGSDELKASLFGDDTFGSDSADEVNRTRSSDAWGDGSAEETKGDLFAETEQEEGAAMNETETWSFGDAAEEKGGLFESLEEGEVGLEGFSGGLVEEREDKGELDEAELDKKEKELRETLKGLDLFVFEHLPIHELKFIV
jgi:hypothetical protein